LDPQTGTVATGVAAPVVKVADRTATCCGVIVDFVAGGGGVLGAVKDTSDARLATTSSWTLGTSLDHTVTTTAGRCPL